jgi:4-carboxymuconolactone decarboxylase
MTDTPRKSPFADIAPALGDYTDNLLFGDVWKRPQLSPRDRSLVTVSSLVAQYRMNELPFRLKFAMQNGITREELIEAITHLAFYAGWPMRERAGEVRPGETAAPAKRQVQQSASRAASSPKPRNDDAACDREADAGKVRGAENTSF